MRKGTKMTKEQRQHLKDGMKGRVPWNKGLTKEDPRVLKNISGGSRDTQFKSGQRPETKAEGNANWKGGRIVHQGYVYLLRPEHPYNKNGYVQEHRLVMESALGRILLPEEIVHHINHNKLDNTPENLMLLSQGQHTTIHNNERWNS